MSRKKCDSNKYAYFSSALCQRQLSERHAEHNHHDVSVETVYSAVLLADISGFTRLSARLTAEQLETHINEYFTLLINVVKENYGDVVKFLGDAVLVLWPIDKESSYTAECASVLMASMCALQLINDCGEYDRGEGENKVSLRLHCGIGSGLVHCMCMGDKERWEYVVSGEPLLQVGYAVASALTGEVCLSKYSYQLIQDKLEALQTLDGNYKLTGRNASTSTTTYLNSNYSFPKDKQFNRKSLKKLKIRTNRKKLPLLNDSVDFTPFSTVIDYLAEYRCNDTINNIITNEKYSPDTPTSLASFATRDTEKSPPFSPSTAPKKSLYMPTVSFDFNDTIIDTSSTYQNTSIEEILPYFAHDAARKAIENSTLAYLSELRTVVTLFIGLVGLEEDFENGLVQRPQQALLYTLTCLKRFGGSLRQYVVDDKGCVIIAAFGLPGSSHEDNCSRAVETAISIRTMLKSIEVECQQGIAEGKVYCGLVGASDRCEYAMMGCSVNLAARLMGQCEVGKILVNDTVFQIAQQQFAFQELPKIVAKGYLDKVAVYSPIERVQQGGRFSLSSSGTNDFFGRKEEVDILIHALKSSSKQNHTQAISNLNNNNNHNNNESKFIILDGDAGVGKTRIISEAFKEADRQKIDVNPLVGIGSTAHSQSPYYFIRQLLLQIFGLDIDRSLSSDVHNDIMSDPFTLTHHKKKEVTKKRSSSSSSSRSSFIMNQRSASYLSSSASSSSSSSIMSRENYLHKREEFYMKMKSSHYYQTHTTHNTHPVTTTSTVTTSSVDFYSNPTEKTVSKESESQSELKSLDVSKITQKNPFQSSQTSIVEDRPPPPPPHPIAIPNKNNNNGNNINRSFSKDNNNNNSNNKKNVTNNNNNNNNNNSSSSSSSQVIHALDSSSNSFEKRQSLRTTFSSGSQKFSYKLKKQSSYYNKHALYSSQNSSLSISNNDIEYDKIYQIILTWFQKHNIGKSILKITPQNHELKSEYPLATIDEFSPISADDLESACSSKAPTRSNSILSLGVSTVSTLGDNNNNNNSPDIHLSKFDDKEFFLDDQNIINFSEVIDKVRKYSDKPVTDLIPLLGPVLLCHFKDTLTISQKTVTQRLEAMENLILYILTFVVDEVFSVFVIDNLQWIDSHSLQLLLKLIPMTSQAFLLISVRSFDNLIISQETTITVDDSSEKSVLSLFITTLLAMRSNTTLMKISSLHESDVREIIEKYNNSELLGSHPNLLSPKSISEVRSRSGGSPLHTIVLAQGLSQALSEGTFTSIQDLPTGAHNIVMARFDQLNNTDQVILKTASVFGLEFSEEELRATLILLDNEHCAEVLSENLQQLVHSHLIVLQEQENYHNNPNDDEEEEGNINKYYVFTDHMIQESIYNLMLITAREDVHQAIASHLEEVYSYPERVHDIAYHYINSNNRFKKIEYLIFLAEKSYFECNYILSWQHYESLLVVGTRRNALELFEFSCRKFRRQSIFTSKEPLSPLPPSARRRSISNSNNHSNIIHNASSTTSSPNLTKGEKDSISRSNLLSSAASSYSPPTLTISQHRGYSDNSGHIGLDLDLLKYNSHNSTLAFHNRYIAWNDIHRPFRLIFPHPSKGSDLDEGGAGVVMTEECNRDRVCYWLCMLSICAFKTGRYIESHNLTQLALYNLNILQDHAKKQSIFRSMIGLPLTWSCCCFPRAPPHSLLPVTLTVRYLQSILDSLFNTTCILIFLRGQIDAASQLLEAITTIIQYDRERDLDNTEYYNNIEGKDISSSSNNNIVITDTTTTTNTTTAVVATCNELKLLWENKRVLYTTRSDMLKSMILKSTSSKTVPQLISQITSISLTHPGIANDPIINICLAIHTMSHSEFVKAYHHLQIAELQAMHTRDCHLYNIIKLLVGYVSLMSGNIIIANECIDQVVTFASEFAYVSMHIGALQLKMLQSISIGEMTNIDVMINTLKRIQQNDKLSTSTNAIVCFAFTSSGRLTEAETIILNTCQSLSQRVPVSPISGIILFCSIYAALDVLESYNLSFETGIVTEPVTLCCRNIHHTSTSTSTSSSLNFLSDRQVILLKRTDLGKCILQAIGTLESYCVIYPCLLTLLLAMFARVGRLFGAVSASLALQEIERKVAVNKGVIELFTFGNTYLELQRSLLCEYLRSCSCNDNNMDSNSIVFGEEKNMIKKIHYH